MERWLVKATEYEVDMTQILAVNKENKWPRKMYSWVLVEKRKIKTQKTARRRFMWQNNVKTTKQEIA